MARGAARHITDSEGNIGMTIYARFMWKCQYCNEEWETLEGFDAPYFLIGHTVSANWRDKEVIKTGDICPVCLKDQRKHLLSSEIIKVPEGILLVDKEKEA